MGNVQVTFAAQNVTEAQATAMKNGIQTALTNAGFTNVIVTVIYTASV